MSNFNMEVRENSTPKAEFDNRIKKLQDKLRETGIDAALIIQNTDLYYLTGTMQQGHLYVPAEGSPLLMVRKSYTRARQESSTQDIIPFKSPRQIPEILKDRGYAVPRILGMELDVLPANTYLAFQGIFPESKITDIAVMIRMIRAVKSPHEIEMITRACVLSDQLAGCVKDHLKEGMTEVELAGKIEAEARKMGHQGIVRMRLWEAELFYGHLMAGPSAAVPSFLASPTGGVGVSPAVAQGPELIPIKSGEPVLVDYCFVYNGYISDHTRIFSIGPLPDDLIRAYDAMLDVQKMLKQTAKPGAVTGELYDMAVNMAAEKGYADHFMGYGDERIRFIGHGLGLELDEFPFIAKGQELKLEQGMTLALEPKLIFPGKGVVGIENTHVVTEDGLRQLTLFEEGIGVV